ncbi:FAD/NAD(P)-binding protein [Rheinheimera salexigens]|uniref:FAD-dependent urate hydroxylase HpyO/Asp monooxygenase CreE-like FAD/NAD(P)-binding domain-containing protein n=1 Tax=Rheinheimera salexigens TaxID=1628148 RepID=A0A1E7Q3F4_9GAMM|nr:FAD/NAD(P)-binding protein [Rheinheimera salexigens]OEY68687.1 hypothetical protein BI198_03215 [Rheinheimera salexigens]
MVEMKIALVGGGPSALFMVKKLIAADLGPISIDVFESATALGKGMPYSHKGALNDHISNVSSDELPPLVDTLESWLKQQDPAMLTPFHIDGSQFHAKVVVPRLLLGSYLEDQFHQLIAQGQRLGIRFTIHLNSTVCDIEQSATYSIIVNSNRYDGFDKVIICTGHLWPKQQEAEVAGYFNSPYPPHKLNKIFNHPVALKGSSLTAVDAIRTLSKANGHFLLQDKRLIYQVAANSTDFKIVMFSLDGLLPSVRYHVDDTLLSSEHMLTDQQLVRHKHANAGFVSLDFLFEQNFKQIIKHIDPNFYQTIAGKNLESFANWLLESRKAFEPFNLLTIEYIQAEQSIQTKQSIHWKKLFSLLSFSINHPAKYLSAEDMLRLQQILQPLIAIIIADIPQSSAEQLLALHNCGKLDIIAVDTTSQIKIKNDHEFYYVFKDSNQCEQVHEFKTFIDCTGQKPFAMSEFPFKSLFINKQTQAARVKFKHPYYAAALVQSGAKDISLAVDADYYLNLPGFAINDDYQFVYADGSVCNSCFMMAVPFISGFNPDYSGFDFCDQVSSIIVEKLKQS